MQAAVKGLENSTFDFGFMSLANLDLGTTDINVLNLFVDPSLLNGEAEILASDCAAYKSDLKELSKSSESEVLKLMGQYNCTTAITSPAESYRESTDAINAVLYCGFRKVGILFLC